MYLDNWIPRSLETQGKNVTEKTTAGRDCTRIKQTICQKRCPDNFAVFAADPV